MSQVLITGATGLVGDHLLRLLIQDRRVNYIAAPTRRPLADISGVFNPHDPQLTDALAQVQDPIDIAFCCLGTTRRGAKRHLSTPTIRWWWTPRLRRKSWGPDIFWWSARWAPVPDRLSSTTR